MENHVKNLQELILKEFTFIKFFKKIGYQFSQKAQARDSLREALKVLASEEDEYSQKAISLLDVFDEQMNSCAVEKYWNGLKVQNERDKTRTEQLVLEEKKEQHSCLIDSNVIIEHNRSSNRLTLESSIDVVV
ncbi:14408_t:CDS:2 [Funneliformis geosporum]|uniref:15566_t:CDS:1 n=1 Tax=Funneliformis geosporum TaxID=1117311 RepID=A0A9W4WY35_9GLOM|nr:15566_t:CDS:2 [Funneliformis geosporum]CAI2194984.1 14408_t:CDS:2 [Funneliformis geosporum]